MAIAPDAATTLRQTHSELVARILRDQPRDALVSEHAARPFGPHSDNLSRVLYFMRAQDTLGKYVIVVDDHRRSLWHVAKMTGQREQGGVELTGQTYTSIEAAEHAIFLMRLDQLRIGSTAEEVD